MLNHAPVPYLEDDNVYSIDLRLKYLGPYPSGPEPICFPYCIFGQRNYFREGHSFKEELLLRPAVFSQEIHTVTFVYDQKSKKKNTLSAQFWLTY